MHVPRLRTKIVFLTPSLQGGGAERVFLTLLRHLDRKEFEPHLVVLRAEGEFTCQLPHDVVLHTLGGGRYGLVFQVFLSSCSLVWLLRKIHPRAVLSNGRLSLLLALARPMLPRDTKVLAREPSLLSVRIDSDTWHPRLWRWLYQSLYRWVDRVVCHTDTMVMDMTEQFKVPKQRSIRIYNPIDVELVRGMGMSGASPYGGPGPNLVAAGRLSKEKGFDLLLAAMPKSISLMVSSSVTITFSGFKSRCATPRSCV